jgi:WhiB family transcriptional regulator, redox-sensing transcriptional regulator
MPRRGTATRPGGGGPLMFLEHLPAGLAMPKLPDALCSAKGQDPDLWHPDNGNRADAEAAKAICQKCPARVPCLQWAIDANEQYGVWGGTTPRERIALRKARAQATATKPEVAA